MCAEWMRGHLQACTLHTCTQTYMLNLDTGEGTGSSSSSSSLMSDSIPCCEDREPLDMRLRALMLPRTLLRVACAWRGVACVRFSNHYFIN